MLRKLFFLIIITFVFACPPAEAAKVLPRSASSSKSTSSGGGKTGGGGFYVTPRLRGDRKALNVSLGALSQVKSVTYTLYYQTNGKDEGVSGSIDGSSGNNVTREILFGTCSAGVCRYHTNITGMSLEVSIEYLNGKKGLRKYKIKV